MDKEIRKLINEAFGEVFSEDASGLAKKLSDDEKIKAERLVQDIKTLGANSSINNNYGVNPSTTNIFNYVVDRVIEDYINSGDEKIKQWVQSALYPSDGTKYNKNLLNHWSSKDPEEMQDAMLNAYERIMLSPGEFEKMIQAYADNPGTKFADIVLKRMNSRINDYFKGYREAGSASGQDVMGKGGVASLDQPLDDETGETMASRMDLKPGIEGGFVDPEEMDRFKEIQGVVLGWLKNNVSEKQYVAWREVTKGSTPNQIAEEFPELFKNNKDVSRNYSQLVSSPKAQELSELISHAFDIEWSMSDVNPKSLQQTSSMDPSFGGGFTKRARVSTPEMQDAQKRLNDVMAGLGLKPAQFNSEAKIDKIVANLEDRGETVKADEVNDAYGALIAATEKAKSRGQYDVNVPVLPSSEEEEESIGKLFEALEVYEGFELEKLMERVMKRLSK